METKQELTEQEKRERNISAGTEKLFNEMSAALEISKEEFDKVVMEQAKKFQEALLKSK